MQAISTTLKSILACFSNNAVVRDEQETFDGKQAIEGWIMKTIEKYKFQFKPLRIQVDDPEVVAAVQVSGTFDGSPVTPRLLLHLRERKNLIAHA